VRSFRKFAGAQQQVEFPLLRRCEFAVDREAVVDQNAIAAKVRPLHGGQSHCVASVFLDGKRQREASANLVVRPGQQGPRAEEALRLDLDLGAARGLRVAKSADQVHLPPGYAALVPGRQFAEAFRLAGLVPESDAAEKIRPFHVETVQRVVVVPFVLDRQPQRLREADWIQHVPAVADAAPLSPVRSPCQRGWPNQGPVRGRKPQASLK